jgi:hypothetical protein
VSRPIDIDCYPVRRNRARVAFLMLSAALLLALIAISGGAHFTFAAVCLPFAVYGLFEWRRCRRIKIFAGARQATIVETGEALTSGSILGIITHPRGSSAVGHLERDAWLGGENVFALSLWTHASTTARAAPLLKLARNALEPLRKAELEEARAALGPPNRTLMLASSPAEVLAGARALASALEVPWLHFGEHAIALHASPTLALPLGRRPTPYSRLGARLKQTAFNDARPSENPEEIVFSWYVERAADVVLLVLMAAVLFAVAIAMAFRAELWVAGVLGAGSLAMLSAGFLCAIEHGRHRVVVASNQLIVRKWTTVAIPLDDLLDVEPFFFPYWDEAGLCICAKQGAVRLPVRGHARAAWLAERIADAVRSNASRALNVPVIDI